MATSTTADQPGFPLIGAEGASFVANTLASKPPQQAIRAIQNSASLLHPLCTPLLGMVDQLGIPRYEAHRGILTAAKHALLARVQHTSNHPLSKEQQAQYRVKLERLLGASFKYLGIPELRDVPLAIMEKLEQVPPVFLKQLAMDPQIFRELPAKVQRQVWEFDKNLLQADALPPVGQYKYEVATVMRSLAMDEFLPAVLSATATAREASSKKSGAAGAAPGSDAGSGPVIEFERDGPGGPAPSRQPSRGLPPPRPVTRKILRKGSFVVQLLRGMVGHSIKIYSQVVELCCVRYRDSDSLYCGHKEASYCTLRAQLLMALHDMNSQVATRDRCHELAWTLDAGMTNGHLTQKHLAKLNKFFEDLEKTEGQAAERAAALKRQGKNKPGHVQDEAESAGNVVGAGGAVEPYRVLGDAGVILRDPSAQHLLAGAALQMVLPAALAGTLPSELKDLVPVLRMMALGVDSRQMLRDTTYKFPEVDPRLIKDLMPLLATWMLQHEAEPSPPANTMQGTVVPGEWGVPKQAVSPVLELLPKSEVARRITQTFALERLLSRDWLGCCRTLKLLATALKPAAILEGWDFAGALALRLSEVVKSRQVSPGCSLWHYAMDHLLVRAVDAHTQVHEEVLRLLLAAAPQLKPEELGTYLGLTLQHSKKSRRRQGKKSATPALTSFPNLNLAGEVSDMGSDIGSDGWAGVAQLKLHASDGVRSVYAQFSRLSSCSRGTAPALFEYLAEQQQDPQQVAAAAAAASLMNDT